MRSQPIDIKENMGNGDRDVYLCGHYERLGDQANDFRNKNLIELICSLVQGPDVLDIGCGTGGLLDQLHQKDFGRLVGVEPSEGLIELARRLRPHLKIVCGAGDAITRITGQFDSVTIIDVLEHIEDDRRQLKMIYERLKPGGQLLVLVPAHPILFGPRDQLQGHFRRYTRRELVGKLKETGFDVQQTRSWNAIAWLPQFIYGKCLGRIGGDGLRSSGRKGPLQRGVIRLLDTWYAQIENRHSFGFGLSLICKAVRPKSPDG